MKMTTLCRAEGPLQGGHGCLGDVAHGFQSEAHQLLFGSLSTPHKAPTGSG